MPTIVIRHSAVLAHASKRPPGYVEAVLAKCRPIGDGRLEIAEKDYRALKKKYDPDSGGPGTELKMLLAGFPFYIQTTASCSCNAKAKVMDKQGAEWCRANLATIVGWLKDEHTRRGLKVPFSSIGATALIKIAIRRARKRTNV